MKIDRKGKVSVLVDKKNFTRNVSFLNAAASSSDRKSIFVTDMGVISMMFDPDKDLDSKQAKELTAEGCVYQITLDGKITDTVVPGNSSLPGPNGVGRVGENRFLLYDFLPAIFCVKLQKGS